MLYPKDTISSHGMCIFSANHTFMYHMYLNKTKIEEHIYFSVNRRHRVVVFFLKKIHTFFWGGGKEPKNGTPFQV